MSVSIVVNVLVAIFGAMFGEKRLTETLNQSPDAEPEAMIRRVYDAVIRFTGEAEQFDDITMLCFRYSGIQPRGGERMMES